MMRLKLSLLFLLPLLLMGCATAPPVRPQHLPSAADALPAEALITQRGVLTVRGRQFSLVGYVAKSVTGGLRLVMMENFGGVLADVLVKPDGKIYVMQSKPPFRPAWIERYIANDLQCIFGEAMDADCPVTRLSPTHFIVERRWYKLELRTVEVKAGSQSPEMFDERKGGKP